MPGHNFGIGRGRLIRYRGTGQKAGGGMGIIFGLNMSHDILSLVFGVLIGFFLDFWAVGVPF